LRGLWAAALLGTFALPLFGAGPAAAELGEPVTLTPSAPEVVAVNQPFRLKVEVEADVGALGIADPPLRLRVRMGPRCGGSFAGTEGTTVFDEVLPAPGPRRYDLTYETRAKLTAIGTETVCAFLEDSEERQFATDVETTVTAASGCTVARRRVTQGRRALARANRRLATLRRHQRHSHGAERRALTVRVRAARKHRHGLIVRLNRAKRQAKTACGAA
jgi:hypothetical protein